VIATVLVYLAVWGGALSQGALLDRALAALWSAENLSSREKAAGAVARLAPDFDGLYQRLEGGPRYSKDVETGLIEESRKGTNGLRQEYVFLVPEDYDPEKKYRVSFYLHGGVNRAQRWQKGDPWWKRFDRSFGSEQISVFLLLEALCGSRVGREPRSHPRSGSSASTAWMRTVYS
jgi:acetyl esterase/lipase